MPSHENHHRLPRLYVEAPLHEGAVVTLAQDQVHYLKTVLRRPDGAALRVFNGREGEWLGALSFSGKKDGSLIISRQNAAFTARPARLHLAFCLIKKDRMDFMLEKSVEIGATDLHPLLSDFTILRDFNAERAKRQIIEAAEQCERSDLPALHPLRNLRDFCTGWKKSAPLLVAMERSETLEIRRIEVQGETGLLIGPEGGWSDSESSYLSSIEYVKQISLGNHILRAETAAIYGLSILQSKFTK